MNDPATAARPWMLFLAAAILVAACGGNDPEAGEDTGSTESSVQAAGSETTLDGASPEEATADSESADSPDDPPEDAPEWVMHETDESCVCADGSEFVFFSRQGSTNKVMLYFQGGGACFNEDMCAFEGGTYKVDTGPDDHPDDAGIFDRAAEQNPLADWSIVFVPYCTGDVHLGDATTEYGELTVQHRGHDNAQHAYSHLVENFGDASQVLVSGSSAGGVPAPLYAGFATDDFPDADVAALADASGGYPSNPPTNAFIGGLWGIEENIPDWPATADVAPGGWGLPDLFAYAADHAPRLRMARYDNAWDEVQRTFSAFAGVGDAGLPAVLDQNEDLAEADGATLDVYIAPGDDHTILGEDAAYELEVEGVAFIDWLTTFVEGGQPGDVRCTDCERPADA